MPGSARFRPPAPPVPALRRREPLPQRCHRSTLGGSCDRPTGGPIRRLVDQGRQTPNGAASGAGVAIEYGRHVASLPPDEREHARKAAKVAELAATPDDEVPDEGERARAAFLEFDFETPLPAPDYVVDRLFERETVNMLSGDTGAGKSIMAQSLAVAVATGRPWLGREVSARSVIYLDEENPYPVVYGRLRAMGLCNAHRERLHYANRQGLRIGEDKWNAWLRREAAAHEADLIVIDTAMAATIAEVNENDAVVKLYGALRPIASELQLAILILHHERKHQPGQTRDRSQAMMGARQWAGQADRQVAVQRRGDLLEDERGDGGRTLRREFVLTSDAKDRTADGGRPELIAVTSAKDAEGRLEWMKVESEGPVEPEETQADRIEHRIVAAAQEAGEAGITTAALADAAGADKDDGTFKRAKLSAEKSGRLVKVKQGTYRADAAGEGLSIR